MALRLTLLALVLSPYAYGHTTLSAKVKTLATLQDKMVALEGNLESLATALKNRPRPDDKIAALQDKLAALERQQANFVDLKTVESALAMRLPRELHDVESRVNQSIAFVTEKLEAKVQSLEKAAASQRAESIASLKSELVDDLQRLAASTLRKSDVVPLQHAQTQLRDDLAQLSSAVERHDKRTQDAKQMTAQLRDELSETKQELLKTLSAQQTRAHALLDDRLAQLSDAAKEKADKVEQQVAALSKKHKRTDDAMRTLQADVAKVQTDALAKQSTRDASHEREHEALRVRLARSVAELEALSLAKTDLERRFAKQEKQLTTKLKVLQAKAAASERAQEAERQTLVQRIQDGATAMGVAQGKTALLETLLANEKRQHNEKSELVRATRQEMLALRQRKRTVESDAERTRQKLSTELHAKQQQVESLQKKLAKSDADAAKAIDTATRDAAQLRRLKVAKEHELRLAKLRLEELERAAAAVPPTASVKTVAKSALDDAESKRRELERLLLDAQLQVDELTQELDKTRRDHNAASERRQMETTEQLETLTRTHETQLAALNDAVAAKDEAMQRVRETLVDKSTLEALDVELCALRDEKTALTTALEQTQRDHARAMRERESKTLEAHAMEIESLTRTLEARTTELDDARAAVDELKRTIATLEQELSDHASTHADELATVTADLTESRATIASLTTDVTTLRAERAQLERELERVQSELETAMEDSDTRSAAKDEELMAQEAAMQQQIEDLTRALDDAESALVESKNANEASHQKLLDVVAAQEAAEASLKSEIDMLLLSLEHERASSRTREQELTATITSLEATSLTNANAHETSQAAIASVSESLKASESREQALQRRIASIVRDITAAASAFEGDAPVTSTDDGEDAFVAASLAHISATHRSTIVALERLHADYELALAQTADDASTIDDLEAQMKRASAQVEELETVVAELETKLKDQYAQSAQRSDNLEREIAELTAQTETLERAVASKTRECEATQAALDRQLESHATQGEALRAENAKLTAAIAAIRASIERIEASKTHELDAMNATLTELETRTATLTANVHASASAELDCDVFAASHRESVALAQRIRSLQAELTKSASVVEWHDLRSRVFDEEQRLERLALDRSRDAAKIATAEDEILRNADFLRALLMVRGDGDGSSDWMRKYVASAPDMVERLQRLETQLHDAVALASDRLIAARGPAPVNSVESSLASEASARVVGRLERRLSDSCEDASDVLEASQDAESEQSMLESMDESEQSMSESAADLDDSMLDASAAMDDDVRPANELPQSSPARDEAVADACTTLLLGHAPNELLVTDFAPRETSVESAPALLVMEAAHMSSSRSDSEHDDEEDAADATDDGDEVRDATADAATCSFGIRSHEPIDQVTTSPSVMGLSPAISRDSRDDLMTDEKPFDLAQRSLAASDDGDDDTFEHSEDVASAHEEDLHDDDLIDSEDEDDAQDASANSPSSVQATAVGDSSRHSNHDVARHDDFDEAPESDGELSHDAADTRALELALERRGTESERLASTDADQSALVASTDGAAVARVPTLESDRKDNDIDEDADELLASMDETQSEDLHENGERELKEAAHDVQSVAQASERDALDAHESDDENLSEFDHVPVRVAATESASESDIDDDETELKLELSAMTQALGQEKQATSALDSVANRQTFSMEEDDMSDEEAEMHERECERLLIAESACHDDAEQQSAREVEGEDDDEDNSALEESIDSVDNDRSLESSLDDARDLDRSIASRNFAAEDAGAVEENKVVLAFTLNAASTLSSLKRAEGGESDKEEADDASIDNERGESAPLSLQSAVATQGGADDLETSFDDEADATAARVAAHEDADRDALAHALTEDHDDDERVDDGTDDDARLDQSADSEQLERSFEDDRFDRQLSDETALKAAMVSEDSRHNDKRATTSSDDEDDDEDSSLEKLAQRVPDESTARVPQSSANPDGSDDELIDSDSDDDVDEDASGDFQATGALPAFDSDSKDQVDVSSSSSNALSHEDDDVAAHCDARVHDNEDDGEEAKALAGQFSGMETASTASGHSQDDDASPFYRATPADARVVDDDEEHASGSEDDEFAFDARRLEPSLPAAPTRLQTNALAPLPSLSRLGSGAGTLKKALSAATRTYDDEDDDDMDEVERLLVAQSLARPSNSSLAPVVGSSASFGSKALGKATRSAFEPSDEDGGDGDEDDEFQAPASLADAHRELMGSTARPSDGDFDDAEGDDFEDHDLASSPRDEHDESFDDGDSREQVRVTTDERLERKGDAVATRGRATDDAADSGDEAIDSSDDSDDSDATRFNAPASSAVSIASRTLPTMTSSNSLSSRSQLLSLSLGRRVALEEDDDMDDVERLLLEQTSMRQPSTVTRNDLRSHDSRSGPSHDDDDEFGDDGRLETSEQELSASFDDRDTAAAARAHAPDDSMEHSEDLDALARTLDRAPQRRMDNHDAVSDSSESESESEATRVRATQQLPQRSLAPLGLGAARATIGRMCLEEDDDDMDEVERLLHAQTSMKQSTSASVTTRSALTRNDDNDNDDDEFGEASLEAAALTHDDSRNAEDDRAIDSETDEDDERQSPSRSGSLSSRNGDASSPSAATRIPILSGSNLVDRVASDAIPSMLASSVSASAEAVESEIASQVAHLSRDQHDRDDEDDDDAYLEESFDLEESLQDDDDGD